jgi:type VI secretion system protein ImpK
MVKKPAPKRARDIETSFVLKFFEAFYYTLLKEKERIQGDGSTGSDSASSLHDGESPVSIAKEILEHLYQLLTQQAVEASRFGGEFAANYYKEAQYIMASLADEVFLNIEWAGRSYWEDNLLESKIFGTHDAGDLFFSNLDDFLQTRDPLRKDIAELYLLALGLGFQGKYRGIDDQGKIDAYKQALYVFINHRESHLFKEGERLFSESYNYTLDTGGIKLIEDTRVWMGIFSGVFLVLLFASFLVWYHATADIKSTLADIFRIAGLTF